MVKHAGQKTTKHWYADAGPVEARQRNFTLMSFSCSDFLNPPGMDESAVLPARVLASHLLPSPASPKGHNTAPLSLSLRGS